MNKKVYIVSACRTPIGKMGSALSSMSAVNLGAIVVEEVVKRSGIKADNVEHVYMGCVIQASLGQNVARQAALKAGLPFSVTAETINVVCGSGLDSVNQAARMIQSGDADVVVAGGMESMSNAPYALKQARFGYRMGNADLIDTMVIDALWDAENDYHMGITAENISKKWNLTREELDLYAAASQQKACKAMEEGVFEEEIVSVAVKVKNQEILVNKDEGPRQNTTTKSLARLKPVFKKDGIVTAGNSSGINDGAAAVLLVSEDKVKAFSLKPMAEWMGGALGGVAPEIMGIGPVESTKKLMKRLEIAIEDIDLIEANEAFAAQSIAVQRELNIPSEKLNIHGGAIALGHPVGASGCRILVTLLYAMKRANVKTGLATLCIGGGMGCSTIIRRVDIC